ncbi:MAG: DUF5723 family protein [Flavobacteriales bacterium]
MSRCILLTLLASAMTVQAQEQLGIANSNWAGTDAVPLNPARMATQWPWLDINLVGANLFAWNDYVYLGKQHSLVGEIRNGIHGTNGDLLIGTDRSPRDKRLFASAEFKGPAFAWSLGRTAIGLSMRTRAMATAIGLPNSLAVFGSEGLSYSPQHGIRYPETDFRSSTAAWTEFGGSVARIISANGNTLLSGGLTAKYIMAHAGAALQVDQFDYEVLDTARIEVYNARAQYGFATPGTNAGKGFGVDVGLEYQRTEHDASRYVPHSQSTGCAPAAYLWRLGVSVIDIGGMKFNEAIGGTLVGARASIPDYDGMNVDGAEGLDSLFTADFTGYHVDNALSIGLPTAVSVQYDRRIADRFFVAADLVQPMAGTQGTRLRRVATVAIVPRYETKRLEAALPIVLHEYRKPTVGLMLRLNNLIIGTDNILPLVSRPNVYSVDAYVRLKITLFKSPFCRGRRDSSASSKPGATSLPCTGPTDR